MASITGNLGSSDHSVCLASAIAVAGERRLRLDESLFRERFVLRLSTAS